jgi:lipopolysaccharide biosynthesis regulator YciM
LKKARSNVTLAHCYKCGTRCKFEATQDTRYWICPKCKALNKCENLIKKVIVDTVQVAEEAEEV